MTAGPGMIDGINFANQSILILILYQRPKSFIIVIKIIQLNFLEFIFFLDLLTKQPSESWLYLNIF